MAYSIQEIPVEDLSVYVNNSRTHSTEQVKQISNSIKEFGFTNPLLIDKNKEIIAGHGRLMAAKQLGLDKVPCIELSNLSEKQKKAYVIADNQLALNAGWNESILSMEIGDLSDNDFDISLLGFNDLDLNKYLLKEFEGLTDEDEVPETPEEPITKLGDIYKLGNHRLMCGDSLMENQINDFLKDKKIKLLLTDPPYELITKGGGIFKSSNSMNQIKTNKLDKFNPEELFLYCNTNIYFHNKPLIKQYIELAEKNNQKYDLCFYKKENVAPNYGGHMMTDVEYIAIIGEQNPNKGFEKEMYSKLFVGKKDKDNKLSYSKPVKLCEKYIKLYADKYVLDLFGGSGSTLIACEKLNKICYMVEHNPVFIDVIVKRWENFTGKKAKLIKDNHATT